MFWAAERRDTRGQTHAPGLPSGWAAGSMGMLLGGQLPHRKSAGSTEVTEDRRFRGQIQMSPAARRSMVRRSQGNRTEGKRAKGGGDVEVSCQLVSNQELYICRRNLTEPYFGESKKSLCELKTRHPKEKKMTECWTARGDIQASVANGTPKRCAWVRGQRDAGRKRPQRGDWLNGVSGKGANLLSSAPWSAAWWRSRRSAVLGTPLWWSASSPSAPREC